MRSRWNKFGKNMKPQWDGGGPKVNSKCTWNPNGL